MKSLIFILLLLSPLYSFAQFSVQGHVIDGENSAPLPGANVFIANSTYGVSTGVDGAFVIKGLRAAHYQLVISFIGYETQVIEVNPATPVSYKVILKPSTKTLREVVVRSRKASRAEWLSNFKIFKERFIGLSENARGQPTGKKMQLSNIILHKPALVEAHGEVYPRDAIETRGYWSWELMAESLPLDYDPEHDLKVMSEEE